jgi:8-oxo-dGTP pyrophosphatase MutT (NUDIX family)
MPEVQQAGAIAFRTNGGEPEFLVVTARRNPDHWIFPKGHVEPGEADEAAAVRELHEEAAVTGTVVQQVGVSRYRNGSMDVRVVYFLVRAHDAGGSAEGRRIEWLTADEALARVSFEDLRALLAAARRLVPGGELPRAAAGKFPV